MSAPSDEKKASSMTSAQQRSQYLFYPLFGFPIVYTSYYAFSAPSGPVWFHLHPLAMLVAFVGFAGNSILVKKVGGYANTVKHGNYMFGSLAAAIFGAYVIYTQKEMMKRPHAVSLHAQLGWGVVAAFTVYPLVGYVLYNPDNGLLRTNKLARAAHKWGGRLLVAASLATIVLGMLTVEKSQVKQAAAVAPLALLAPLVLI